MLDLKRVLASKPRAHEQGEMAALTTPEGRELDESNVLPLHPHPQFARTAWQSLNGTWDYAIVPQEGAIADDEQAVEAAPAAPDAPPTPVAWENARFIVRHAEPPAQFDGTILVPFSPEAPLSGVRRQLQPTELLWYRRTFTLPADAPVLTDPLQRLLLHFEAVDYACACRVNGMLVGEHEGAYLPFACDISTAVHAGDNVITLCVLDPSDAGEQPRGKQRLYRADIWYTAQSGIWQSVWLETVPAQRIADLLIDANPDAGDVTIAAQLTQPGAEFSVTLLDAEGATIAQTSSMADSATVAVSLPVNSPHLWGPDDPYLYDLVLRYGADEVRSYCAFRTTTVEPDAAGIPRFCLNHEPLFLQGVLDQGYWPDGLLTAPAEESLVRDIETARDLGFNMLRKHLKVESDRWYYLCDRAGMLVWQDMVSGGNGYEPWHTSYKPTLFRPSWGAYRDDTPSHRAHLRSANEAYRNAWRANCEGTVRYLRNHPCIVTWVLFNESMGQFDARANTAAVRALDPTRPIDATSGWYDQRCGDFLSVHNYFRDLRVYHDSARPRRAFAISEFGGLTLPIAGHTCFDEAYGYDSYTSVDEWRAALRDVLDRVRALEPKGLAAFVYTQLSDVEEETNGLLTYDRAVNKVHD